MKIYYWQSPNGQRNFGDEINSVLWPTLLPQSFLATPNHILVGIGTLLNNRLPTDDKLVIFGSGVGYGPVPISLRRAKIYCVRGPVSAQMLGLDEKFGICDPGILLPELYPSIKINPNSNLGFMPHWMNRSNELKEVCEAANMLYIDPSLPVLDVIKLLTSVDLLCTEAMHGSITADAFRIPWIPILDSTNPHTLRGKWIDWCASVNLSYKALEIPSLNPMLYENLASFSKTASIALKFVAKTGKPILSKSQTQKETIDKLKSRLFQMIKDFSH